MKDPIKFSETVAQYNASSPEERRLQILLAFEAEYDIARPFSVDWAENDSYFIYESYKYYYKPQYPQGVDGDKVSESPHFYEFELNK